VEFKVIKNWFLADRGRITRTAISALLLAILALLPPFGISTYYVHILIGVFIYIVMTGSLRLISLSGQISLGHAGLMCAGAYTSAVLSKNLGWTPWLTIPIGGILALVLAFLVAIPFSRLRGLYFTMISLFFGMAVLAINEVFQSITGGQSGMVGIPRLFGISKMPYYYFFLGLMIVCLFIIHRLEFSRIGQTWKAVAQSHPIASSIGINEVRERIICFAIGGLFAGLIGAAYAHYYVVLSVTTFGFFTSIYIFIYMMVGGAGSFYGPIIGTAVLLLIQAYARNLQSYVPFILAGVLLIVLYLMPQGLAGLPDQIRYWITRLRKGNTTAPDKEVTDHVP
jgi:branched-chain amino acid transport system permease protein